MLLDPVTISQFEHKRDLKIQDKAFFRTLKLLIPPSNLYQEMELGVVVVVFFSSSSSFFFFFIHTVNHVKNVLVVRGERVTGVQVQFGSPILTHSKSSSQRSWPWMTAVAGAVGQGERRRLSLPCLPPEPFTPVRH